MALDAFTGVFTASQLVRAADRRIGNPLAYLDQTSGVEALTAPAYVELQMILDHLAMAWDWPFKRTVLTFNISAAQTTLPTTFWRVSHDDPLWITDASFGRLRLTLLGEDEFYAQRNPVNSGTGTPERAFLRSSDGTLEVDPVPSKAFGAEFHVQPWQPALTLVSSRPWFPWSEYLVSAIATKIAINQDDSRVQIEAQLAAKLMKDIRASISDQGQRTATVQLNRDFFKPPIRL